MGLAGVMEVQALLQVIRVTNVELAFGVLDDVEPEDVGVGGRYRT